MLFDKDVDHARESNNPVDFARCATIRLAVPLPFRIGLLRAINLAGHNKVGMADLCELATKLGLKDAKTLLNSGNIVFRSDASPDDLERTLERAAAKDLGIATDFFVRTPAEWKAMIAANPFPKEAKADPSHLLAFVMKTEPAAKNVTAIQQANKGREILRANGRCVYVYYPDGIGRSPLTNVMTEKTLGSRSTARNWNTVLKLAALSEADGK